MTTLDDLKIPALTNMSSDEAIEYLRQLRLSRRVPVKSQKKSSPKKKKETKMSAKNAQELLKILGG